MRVASVVRVKSTARESHAQQRLRTLCGEPKFPHLKFAENVVEMLWQRSPGNSLAVMLTGAVPARCELWEVEAKERAGWRLVGVYCLPVSALSISDDIEAAIEESGR